VSWPATNPLRVPGLRRASLRRECCVSSYLPAARDAVWLCKVAERQMLRPSFVPPRPLRQLRDLTRYRMDLVGARTAEKQRVEKPLEDAYQAVGGRQRHPIFGVSGRETMAALIAGERDPAVLAYMARSRMRARSRSAGRLSPGTSTTTTGSCWPRCWPGRRDRHRHRRPGRPDRDAPGPLSPRTRCGSMRSQASGRSRPRSSSPRSAWT
jgi:hypothetical protein